MRESPSPTSCGITLAGSVCRSALSLRLETIEGIRAAPPVVDDAVVLPSEETHDQFGVSPEPILTEIRYAGYGADRVA